MYVCRQTDRQTHAHTRGCTHANYSWHLHVLTGPACTCITDLSVSVCLRACPSLPPTSTCLSVCLSAHMPVRPHASLFCLLVSASSSDRHCLSSLTFCRHSDGKQMKIGLLDSCPDCPNPSVKQWRGPLAGGTFQHIDKQKRSLGECHPNMH